METIKNICLPNDLFKTYKIINFIEKMTILNLCRFDKIVIFLLTKSVFCLYHSYISR